MVLASPQFQRFLATEFNFTSNAKTANRNHLTTTAVRARSPCRCSAIAIGAPSSLTDVAGIRWGSTSVQGTREEMEDDLVIRSDGLDGFSFAAVFDGHGGVSSVKFLRDELYKECVTALQDGILLNGGDFNAIKKALMIAFENADKKLLNWLETIGEGDEDESGSTATVMLIGNEVLFISHVGDSSVVLSRSGKVEVLTDSHRPYGSSKASLQEIRRIREAGGWIVNGRICGDIAVSRSFGDARFKTKKNEMLKKGVEERRWSEKFISRVVFNGDLVIASPDTFIVTLGSDAEFVLLASDGLWDYINSLDAVAFVRNQLREHGDVQVTFTLYQISPKITMSYLLVLIRYVSFQMIFLPWFSYNFPLFPNSASMRCTCRSCSESYHKMQNQGSQDNISIIIADLGHTDWQSLPLEQQNFMYEFGQAIATVGIVSLGIWLSSQVSF
ncbi:protein phosphatase 2C 57-like isoform X2 [Durio zibethinus]|uniref:protein-serine/threonine phosphatase n=1 Tax=Durio zibethinus TaxID=66656 RepID=A0A6P5YAN9_DURZI|nr:protein phosphatase 2C 57-like isoform X2 [Durio zibethinus]